MSKTKDKKRVVIRFNSSQEYNLFQRKIEELRTTNTKFKEMPKNATYLTLIHTMLDEELAPNKNKALQKNQNQQQMDLSSKLENLDLMQQIIYETLKNVLFAACKAGEISISELEKIDLSDLDILKNVKGVLNVKGVR